MGLGGLGACFGLLFARVYMSDDGIYLLVLRCLVPCWDLSRRIYACVLGWVSWEILNMPNLSRYCECASLNILGSKYCPR